MKKSLDTLLKTKKRYWSSVFYPESLPSNWEELLSSRGIMWACSPLHNMDVNENGEIKKEHYHIILCFEGPTTGKVVQSIIETLNQSVFEDIDSVRGLYRYFTHRDNPEKYQYNEKDIRYFNGFDIKDFYELSKTEISHYFKLIQQFIIDNDIIEYCDLLDDFINIEPLELYIVVTTHTILFDKYICSRRNKKRG